MFVSGYKLPHHRINEIQQWHIKATLYFLKVHMKRCFTVVFRIIIVEINIKESDSQELRKYRPSVLEI